MLGQEANVPYERRFTRHFNGSIELSALNTATTAAVTVASGLDRAKHDVYLKRFICNPGDAGFDADGARSFIGWTAQGSRTMTSYYEDQADFIPGSGKSLVCNANATKTYSGDVDGADLFFDVDGDCEVEIPIDEEGNAKISYYASSVAFNANKAKWYFKGIVVIDEL
jgi:hypothetical protein